MKQWSWKSFLALLFFGYGVIVVAEIVDRSGNEPLGRRLLAQWPLFLIATITVMFVGVLGLRRRQTVTKFVTDRFKHK